MDSKEIASLWLQDNAVINQKASYYFASIAILAWPVVFSASQGLFWLGLCLSLLAVLLSGLSFLSMARTAAYRDHWRRELISSSSDYEGIFDRVTFKWHENFRSNKVLIGQPIIGLIIWALVAAHFVFKIAAP